MSRIRDFVATAVQQGLTRRDAHALLQAHLQQSSAWLVAHDDEALVPTDLARLQVLLQRHADGEPLAYLLGHQGFYGLELQVSPDTLIPRPDTETLVDWALTLLPPQGAVLDLGTGSGAIALALKSQRPDAAVTATDRSPAALDMARRNAERLGLTLAWRQGSWWSALAPGARFDLVVSNPPYIAEADPHLPALRHEPRQALTAGPDGLADLRLIVAGAADHLKPGGWLLLEHGHDQADAVALLLQAHGFSSPEHRRDLGGHRRCTGGQRH